MNSWNGEKCTNARPNRHFLWNHRACIWATWCYGKDSMRDETDTYTGARWAKLVGRIFLRSSACEDLRHTAVPGCTLLSLTYMVSCRSGREDPYWTTFWILSLWDLSLDGPQVTYDRVTYTSRGRHSDQYSHDPFWTMDHRRWKWKFTSTMRYHHSYISPLQYCLCSRDSPRLCIPHISYFFFHFCLSDPLSHRIGF